MLFRSGRSTHDAIEQCFTVLSKGKSPQWVLEGDIKGCFDHISHEWLAVLEGLLNMNDKDIVTDTEPEQQCQTDNRQHGQEER